MSQIKLDPREHWQRVYQTKAPREVSWYQREALTSLSLIRSVAPNLATSIIDVGGGASTLVDGLLNEGYEDLTVLDVSPAGLDVAKQRLGRQADGVCWVAANVLEFAFSGEANDVWHDRAVFHFMTDASDRAKYVDQVRKAVRLGGHVIVASFGLAAPPKCSGLDVVRYSADSLTTEFQPGFRLVEQVHEEHHTPAGRVQPFVYCSFLKE